MPNFEMMQSLHLKFYQEAFHSKISGSMKVLSSWHTVVPFWQVNACGISLKAQVWLILGLYKSISLKQYDFQLWFE